MDGDFNEILSNDEKSGGLIRASAQMEGFCNGLENCGLVDLCFSGSPYTWSNQMANPDTVRCRLDRLCGNNSWCNFAPLARLQHLTFPGSDHVPILLNLSGRRVGRQR